MLVKSTKELLQAQQQPVTPYMYFVVFLALISSSMGIEGMAYWAYVPQPLLLQPVGCLDQAPIKILTNDTDRLDGFQNSDIRPNTSRYITYKGRADSLPICISLQKNDKQLSRG